MLLDAIACSRAAIGTDGGKLSLQIDRYVAGLGAPALVVNSLRRGHWLGAGHRMCEFARTNTFLEATSNPDADIPKLAEYEASLPLETDHIHTSGTIVRVRATFILLNRWIDYGEKRGWKPPLWLRPVALYGMELKMFKPAEGIATIIGRYFNSREGFAVWESNPASQTRNFVPLGVAFAMDCDPVLTPKPVPYYAGSPVKAVVMSYRLFRGEFLQHELDGTSAAMDYWQPMNANAIPSEPRDAPVRWIRNAELVSIYDKIKEFERQSNGDTSNHDAGTNNKTDSIEDCDCEYSEDPEGVQAMGALA